MMMVDDEAQSTTSSQVRRDRGDGLEDVDDAMVDIGGGGGSLSSPLETPATPSPMPMQQRGQHLLDRMRLQTAE
jgi:hypothetical protein